MHVDVPKEIKVEEYRVRNYASNVDPDRLAICVVSDFPDWI